MIIGFTGTREGMTAAQKQVIAHLLSRIETRHSFIPYVVHGDCLGADTDFDNMIAGMGIRRDIYPCNIESARSHCEIRGAVICLPKPLPPLERNQLIVDKAQCLIATPKEFEETVRSGTWFTVRRGRKANIPIYIVYPDGTLKMENK